ncbi:MAG: hypothetical protein IPO50_15950 [Sphingomonadales bacterium]|nr:hypothetical protein [Sphingomonadales bacterium]
MVSKKERLYAVIPAGLEDWVAKPPGSRAYPDLCCTRAGPSLLNAVVAAVAFYGRVPSISLVLGCMAVAIVGAHRYWLANRAKTIFRALIAGDGGNLKPTRLHLP